MCQHRTWSNHVHTYRLSNANIYSTAFLYHTHIGALVKVLERHSHELSLGLEELFSASCLVVAVAAAVVPGEVAKLWQVSCRVVAGGSCKVMVREH